MYAHSVLIYTKLMHNMCVFALIGGGVELYSGAVVELYSGVLLSCTRGRY